jgi:putative ABC transport system permease protein
LSEGEWPRVGRREILIGQQVSDEMFEEKIKIGSQIIIKGKKFTVVGALNSLGSKSDDGQIYLDINDYYSLTGEKKGSAKMVMVKIEDGASLEGTAESIREDLEKVRKRKVGTNESDFSVITAEKIGEITGSIVGVIQFAIMLFAGISILVGGIGITNTMFTSVRDRTREIGIMKAIGAKNSAILKIFLIESGTIGLIGGLGGTALGLFLAKIVESYGQAHPVFYISASFNPVLIIFGISFSFLVGCISGFFPALKAAKLKPAESLRRFE